jgi:hypothetical protein
VVPFWNCTRFAANPITETLVLQVEADALPPYAGEERVPVWIEPSMDRSTSLTGQLTAVCRDADRKRLLASKVYRWTEPEAVGRIINLEERFAAVAVSRFHELGAR